MTLLGQSYYMLDAQIGVQFVDNDLELALGLAALEEKLVFVDGYATWCVPCQLMDEEVFSLGQAGDFFNRHFINVKIDLEKGVGPLLSARYGIETLPAYFIITSDETLLHQFTGYHPLEELLTEAGTALAPGLVEKAWDLRYEEGGRKPDFLHTYAHAKYASADGRHMVIAREYLATQQDWSTEKNVRFIYHFIESVDSDMYTFLTEHQDVFSDFLGAEAVRRTIDQLVHGAIYNTVPARSTEEISALLIRSYPDGRMRSLKYELSKCRSEGDMTKYLTILPEYIKIAKVHELDSLTQYTLITLEHGSQFEHFNAAYLWMEEGMAESKDPEHYFMFGQLAEKMSRIKEAKVIYKKGMRIARITDNASAAQKLRSSHLRVKRNRGLFKVGKKSASPWSSDPMFSQGTTC